MPDAKHEECSHINNSVCSASQIATQAYIDGVCQHQTVSCACVQARAVTFMWLMHGCVKLHNNTVCYSATSLLPAIKVVSLDTVKSCQMVSLKGAKCTATNSRFCSITVWHLGTARFGLGSHAESVNDLVIMPTIARIFPHAAVHNGLRMLAPSGVAFMFSNQSLQTIPWLITTDKTSCSLVCMTTKTVWADTHHSRAQTDVSGKHVLCMQVVLA